MRVLKLFSRVDLGLLSLSGWGSTGCALLVVWTRCVILYRILLACSLFNDSLLKGCGLFVSF